MPPVRSWLPGCFLCTTSGPLRELPVAGVNLLSAQDARIEIGGGGAHGGPGQVPLRLCQCERASIRFAAAESEGLVRSILDRTRGSSSFTPPQGYKGIWGKRGDMSSDLVGNNKIH